MGMTEQARRSLDQRIYDVMGQKLYRARKELGMHGPEAAVYPLLDALDDCYALLATLFDDPHSSNYHVWKVEDGHPWKESQWPSLRDAGQCDLCTAPEHLHMQANERCGETIPGYPTPENPTKIRRCNKLKNHPGRHGWIGGP